jgi:hypothetical protein
MKRLGVTPDQVAEVDQITPIFKNAEGGLKAVLEAMRFSSQDETIGAFLKKYDSIPERDHPLLRWEAIGIAAEIDMKELAGAIILAMQAASATTVKVIAFSGHPKIMEARVKYGQLPSGEKDRWAIDTALGFLPTTKGPTFIGRAIFGGAGSNLGSVPKGDDDSEDSTPSSVMDIDSEYNDLFPSPGEIQEKLVPIRQKMLPR